MFLLLQASFSRVFDRVFIKSTKSGFSRPSVSHPDPACRTIALKLNRFAFFIFEGIDGFVICLKYRWCGRFVVLAGLKTCSFKTLESLFESQNQKTTQ